MAGGDGDEWLFGLAFQVFAQNAEKAYNSQDSLDLPADRSLCAGALLAADRFRFAKINIRCADAHAYLGRQIQYRALAMARPVSHRVGHLVVSRPTWLALRLHQTLGLDQTHCQVPRQLYGSMCRIGARTCTRIGCAWDCLPWALHSLRFMHTLTASL